MVLATGVLHNTMEINVDIGEENYHEDSIPRSPSSVRDLQQEITSFCMYLGVIQDPPTAEQLKYVHIIINLSMYLIYAGSYTNST